ncbi:MAG: putative manganese-dependent inorganic diphosphatase [Oscillochloridaceae bacterium umkhey_bin13]
MVALAPPVLVIGHRNPDSDAVCSALAYADLIARLHARPTQACYLDELGPETLWLLQHLGLEPPRPISDVYLRVAEVMVRDVPFVTPATSLRTAGLLMHDHELGALAVLDQGGRLVGVLAREALADRYLERLDLTEHLQRPLATVIEALEADLVTGVRTQALDGQLWLGTFSPTAAQSLVQPGDLLLVEDDAELQQAAVAAGVACLIVARNAPVNPLAIQTAQSRKSAIIHTRHSSLAAALLLDQSVAVATLMQLDPVTVGPDDLLRDVQQLLREGRRAALPVIGPDGRYQGLVLRRHLIPQARRQVILTDHNHPEQAAPGVTESEVLAIIDHHNLGGLQTLQPLQIQIEPVGCTCTLIAEGYQRANLDPGPAMAGAMLGAILSDTLGLRSPTTTPRDHAAVAWLAERCGETPAQLARQLFRARLPDPPPPADWWLGRDWKRYRFGTTNLAVAQVELVDVAEVAPPLPHLQTALAQRAATENLATAFLLLTDILEQSSVLLAANPVGVQLAAQAFGVVPTDQGLILPGIVSRKLQVVPALAAALAGG